MLRLDGQVVSQARRAKIRQEVEQFTRQHGRSPGLTVVLIGEDPASQVYVRNKVKACTEAGISSSEIKLPTDTSAEVVQETIARLNADPSVDGILVQLPLPPQLQAEQVLNWIDPRKDPDGLTLENIGLLHSGRPRSIPCTPFGVMKILEHFQIPVAGRLAAVVGRSQIVGKPMAQLLLQADATVTVCHSRTPNLSEVLKRAEIVVVAAGRPRFLGREDFAKGAVVVDVGIHREIQPDGKAKIVGDVRYEELEDWARAATPVPGGVGPMTITMLLENTLHLARLRQVDRAK